MADGTAISADVIRQPAAELLGPDDCVRVIAQLHCFREDRIALAVPAGLSVAEIAQQIYGRDRADLVCFIGEHRLYEESWRCRPKPGTVIALKPVPTGTRGIHSILLVVAAAAATWYIGGAGGVLAGAGVGAGWAAVGGALAGAAVGIIGNLLINALFPVSQPKQQVPDQSQTYSISGFQNTASKWGSVPVILGRHRMFPKYGAQPYTELVGNDQYLRCLFIWGYGPLAITDFKIGDTPLSDFDDVEVEHFYGYPTDTAPTLYPGQAFQTDLSILLSYAAGWQTRTVSTTEVDEISIDVVAPNGLLVIDDNGKRFTHTVGLEAEYREIGAPSWTHWFGYGDGGAWSAKTEKTLRRGYRKTVPRGAYEVRIRRITEEYDDGAKVLVLQDVNWTALRGIRNESPIRFPKPLAMTAIRIKATDQLNGVLDNFNGVCTSKVTAWNGSSWVEDTESRNPADLFRWVLQGPGNHRPLGDGNVDLTSLQGWAESCTDEGFTYDRVLDSSQSVYDTLIEIAAAGRAAPSSPSGKVGVIWDQPDAPIIQHFTPRNSWGFSSSRVYKTWPHAFRCRFINADEAWNEDERIVYDDGYDENNATLFEGLEFPGVTSADLVWRHGRFHIAQARLRPEFYSLTVDFENLVCTRGDRVRVTHDVPGFGILAGRVRAVSATLPQTVTLDEVVTQASGANYAIRFRLADGTSLLRSVTTVAGESNSVRLTGSGAMPAVGDLAMFGEADRETVVMRIYAIEPSSNLTAKLTLVDDAPEISEADQGEIPPYEPNITVPPDPFSLPPTDLVATELVYLRQDGLPREGAALSWRVPRRGVVRGFEVQYSTESATGPWNPAGAVAWPQTTFEVLDLDSGNHWFRVRCLFDNGRASGWLVGGPYALNDLVTPPPDVENFRISVLGSTATLTWGAVRTPAFSHYVMRYSPALTGVTWGSAVPYLDNIGSTSVQVSARAGTYLIKAVEIGGLESVNATGISTSVAAITNTNVVEVVTEDPYWAGAMSGVEYDSGLGGLVLSSVSGTGSDGSIVSEGYYDFANAVDLGAVFTSRVTPRIEAYGVAEDEDFFALPDFFDPPDFFRFDPSSWDAMVEVRYTSDDPDGSDPQWSDWEPLTASDYTARAFEFRLYMATRESGLTPLVTALSVTVDMPDRIIADNDVVVTTAGLRVNFDPPFLGFAGVGIAAQDMATGDYYVIDPMTKGPDGFDIIFRDAAGSPVERTFDYVASGYGSRVS